MGFSERSKYIGKDMEGTVKLWEKELERGRETISPLNHRTWVRVCCSKHVQRFPLYLSATLNWLEIKMYHLLNFAQDFMLRRDIY